jgi:hypothetical protein
MKKMFLLGTLALAVTAGTAFAQTGGQHMMGAAAQPRTQQPMMNQGMMGQGMSGMMMGGGVSPCMMGSGMGMSGGQHMMGGMGMSGMMMNFDDYEKRNKFLDETAETRKKLHDLMFEYMEAQRNPETKIKDLTAMAKEMQELKKKLNDKLQEASK